VTLAPLLLALLACAPKVPPAPSLPSDTMLRWRPGSELVTLGPEARQDRGLTAAAEALAGAATSPDARLTTTAVRGALALGHYPGAARFVRAVGGKELPAALLDEIPRDAPVDVGWAWRDFADGRRWWVLGWSPRRVQPDPVPSRVEPGQGVGVRVDGARNARLFVVAPSGRWRALQLTPGETRWVAGLDEPGEHRFEVVDGDRVELLFGVFVGEAAPPLAPLPTAVPFVNPLEATEALYAAANDLRRTNGLAPLSRFATFEPLVQEQAACLSLQGRVEHDSEACPGVPGRASQGYFPRGHYYENLAAADSAAEAWEALLASPGHLANLLCADCTHLSIGAATEPAPVPRLFVVWEVMRFPAGEPLPIRGLLRPRAEE
jgi:hypothetical protein